MSSAPQQSRMYRGDDGRVYCDGTPVMKWQMTEAELKEWFPDEHLKKYGLGNIPCPLCKVEVDASHGKSGLVTHLRTKHPEWYKANTETLAACKTIEELTKAIGEESD